jgi:hypothetical protein
MSFDGDEYAGFQSLVASAPIFPSNGAVSRMHPGLTIN